MDLIVSTQPDDAQLNVLNVETVKMVFGKQDVGLNVETTKLKACHVCVRPLENILFDDIKPAPSCQLGLYLLMNIIHDPVLRNLQLE